VRRLPTPLPELLNCDICRLLSCRVAPFDTRNQFELLSLEFSAILIRNGDVNVRFLHTVAVAATLAISCSAQSTPKQAQELAAYPLTMDRVTRQYQTLTELVFPRSPAGDYETGLAIRLDRYVVQALSPLRCGASFDPAMRVEIRSQVQTRNPRRLAQSNGCYELTTPSRSLAGKHMDVR
jgi:hypothetical protein